MLKINKYLLVLTVSLICYLTFRYTGNKFIYLILSVIANLTVYFFYKKCQSFFGLFMSIFLWLGIWMKMSLAIVFFSRPFNVSAVIMDKALIVSILAFLSLNGAIYFRTLIPLNVGRSIHNPISSLLFFYKINRYKLLLIYLFLYSFVAFLNFKLHIYQRGLVADYTIPLHLKSIIEFFFLVGFPAVGSYLLFFECINNRNKPYLVSMLLIFEGFFSSVSILSRGFIFNISSVIFGLVKYWGSIEHKKKFLYSISFVIFTLFIFSLKIVSDVRDKKFYAGSPPPRESIFSGSNTNLDFLYTRWVGIEEIILVIKKNNLNFGLLKESLNESPGQKHQSFFDINFSPERYANTDWSKNSFISTPGVVAFYFYTGSYIFLFICLFFTFFIMSLLEIFSNIFGGGNIIFTSLVSQILAFRLAHFGFAPLNSYKFFISILSFILLVYLSIKLANKLHFKYYQK